MAFDLGALLKDVSELDTREQIEYLSECQIDDDPNNFYVLSNLEELAANIATCGLQQPIRVRPSQDAEGRFTIVSGHRRRAAIRLLAEEDPERWKEIPCIVERDEVSPSLRQLRLIYANANTRALTPAEIGEQAVQVEMLLYRLKEEGYEFPGRMRDHVAKAVNASTSKLARLKVIRENLEECWRPSFRSAELGESTAYALAQMPGLWQKILFDVHGEKPRHLYEGSVKEYMKRFRTISKICCEHRSDGQCGNQVPMMEKSCRDRWTDSCKSGCCMTCPSLPTCRSACQEAADKKKELRDAARKANQEAAQRQKEREKPALEFIAKVYERVGIARRMAGVSVEELFRAQNRYYVESDDRKQEALEDGTANITTATSLPFGYNFGYSDGMCLCAVADALNCSVDYLLGRTEE